MYLCSHTSCSSHVEKTLEISQHQTTSRLVASSGGGAEAVTSDLSSPSTNSDSWKEKLKSSEARGFVPALALFLLFQVCAITGTRWVHVVLTKHWKSSIWAQYSSVPATQLETDSWLFSSRGSGHSSWCSLLHRDSAQSWAAEGPGHGLPPTHSPGCSTAVLKTAGWAATSWAFGLRGVKSG